MSLSHIPRRAADRNDAAHAEKAEAGEEETPGSFRGDAPPLSAALTVQDADPPHLSPSRCVALAAIMVCTTITASMGGQSVLLAITKIAADLHMAQNEIQWISTAFGIAFGCALLVAGRLADIFGRKPMYIAGMSNLALWLLISGLMKNKIAFFVTRGLCGLGGSMAVPSAIGIIAQTFPPGRTRSIVFATFGAGFPVGAAMGMVLGGLSAGYNWRLIFYVLAAVSIIPAIAAIFVVPELQTKSPSDTSKVNRKIDWFGAFLVCSGMVLLMFTLSDALGAPRGYGTPYIIACLILSILLLISFGFWENYVDAHLSTPCLMKLSLFTRANGKLAAVYAAGTFTMCAFSSYLFLCMLYYQEYEQLTPKKTMLRFIPMAISGSICNFVVGYLAPRVKGQKLFALGCVGTALACLLFAVRPTGASYWRYECWAMCLTVFGADFTQSTGTIFVSKLVDHDEQSVAGGLFQTFSQVGGALGTALVTVIYTELAIGSKLNVVSAQAGGAGTVEGFNPDAFLYGLRGAFWFCFALCVFSLLIVCFTMRGMGYIEERVKPLAVEVGRDEGDDRLPSVSARSATENPKMGM